MHLNLEIAHSNRALTKRADHPKYISIKESVSIELTEVGDFDAPIAVRWTDTSGPGHTRWYNGRHFSPYAGSLTDAGAIDALRALSTAPTAIDGITVGYFDVPAANSYKLGDPRIVEFDISARDHALRSAREFEEDCIIVDGKPYMACGTPQFLLDYLNVRVTTHVNSGDHRPGGHKRPHDGSTSQWFHGNRYDLHEEDDARRALYSLFDLHGVREYVFPEVDLYVPESLHSNCDYARLREAAVFVMDNLPYQKNSELDPAILRGLTAISEALWMKDPSSADPSLLAEALDMARRNIATSDPEGRIYLPQVIWRVTEAVRRHFESEISFAPVLTAGPNP